MKHLQFIAYAICAILTLTTVVAAGNENRVQAPTSFAQDKMNTDSKQDKLQQEPLKTKHYQDLTEPINKIIRSGGNVEEEKENVRKNTNRSHLFLYSTDSSLDNLTNVLVQVISLLTEVSEQHQLMISLKFTDDQSKFMWSRIEGMYYELSPNISTENIHLIESHLSVILLDWRAGPIEEIYFYCQGNSYYRTRVSFPKYVKNFITLHLPSASIPVGMMYTTHQMQRQRFLLKQIQDSDFQVISVTYEIPNPVAVSMESFSEEMVKLIWEHEEFSRKKNVAILLNVNPLAAGSLFTTWREDIRGSMLEIFQSLPYFANLTRKFMETVYDQTYIQLVTKSALQWSSESGSNVILDYTASLDDSALVIEDHHTNIIPFLKTSEESSPCALRAALSQAVHGDSLISVDFDTWRTMARYKDNLNDSTSKECRDDVGKEPVPTFNGSTAILHFDGDMWQVMPRVQHQVKRLLEVYPIIHGIRLSVLMFPVDDLKQDAVSEFVKGSFVAASNFKNGCVVDFEKLMRNLGFAGNGALGNNASEIFRAATRKICEPVFDLITVMVWTVNDVYDYKDEYRNGFPSRYHDLFLTRQVFMQEFPHIQVIIQTFSPNPWREGLARMYGAPILLKTNSF